MRHFDHILKAGVWHASARGQLYSHVAFGQGCFKRLYLEA